MERNRKTYLHKDTRGIIDAILNGDILKAPTKKIPYFNIEVPTELPGVDTNILDPRDTYADASEWETKAKDLAQRFIKNFAKYEGNEAGNYLEVPKITKKLRQKGETISERTVGKYMKEMGIKAQWAETMDDYYHRFRFFSNELQNIWMSCFYPLFCDFLIFCRSHPVISTLFSDF